MARSRNIKPGFFKNEILVTLPFEYRLLFIGLWTMADREGRFEDRPTKVKMELFPADNIDVDAGLQALHDNGFILRYSYDGRQYCQILAWGKHQNPHHKEQPSLIHAPDMPQACPVVAVLIPDSLSLDSLSLDCPAAPDTPSAIKPQRKKPKTSMPDDFTVSARVTAWAAEKGHGQLQAHLDSFKAKVQAHGYTYADWDSAFMEAIRTDWAKLGKTTPAANGDNRPDWMKLAR